MIIAVGSTNPSKIRAVKKAIKKSLGKVEIVSAEVESNVPAQPLSDPQTQLGAQNRAKNVILRFPQADLGIGLEGGVTEYNGGLWSTVWCCVCDKDGNMYCTNGARMRLPKSIALPIKDGEEMGPLMDKLAGKKHIRKGIGMIGVVTQKYVTRSEEYGHIAKHALGLWFGRNWEKKK